MTGNSVAAVVLAAGGARRFGGDKLLHPFGDKPLAAHIADTLAALPLDHRLAVCPADAPERAALFIARGFLVVENPDADRGMGSSLAIGARHVLALDADVMLVCLADMPNVTTGHLERLLALAANHDRVATANGGTRSPPALFGRAVLPQLVARSGDRGARDLLAGAAVVEADAELVRDFDTPADFG